MADISQIKLPGIDTPYDIADTTARQAINDKSLGSLSDTDIQNPVNGQMLKYNSSTQKWENVNGGSGSGDMTKAEYDTNDDGVVNESDVSNAVKFSTTSGYINVSFGVEDGSYGYYDENNNFVDFKSQADIDSAIAAAKVGTATASDVLSGETFTNSSTSGVTGTMPNNGAVSQALNAGESYTIPQGYHNGSGEVTANSLASQTQGTATASDIATGLTAWVNGTKLTGTKEDGSVTITVTYNSSFYNKTMTCTKGTKTYTKTTTSSGSTTFNVNEEGTWTITCNGVSRTVNVVLSYSTQMAITKTVTVYGAAGATISFSDTTGSKTVTLNSSGQSSVSITFIPNQSITFTDTNVAKNPNNLSQNYSKAITIIESTTAIYVMPNNAIYWYGYKSSNYQKGSDVKLALASGSISENTNSITLTYNETTIGFGGIGCALTNTMDISGFSKMCGIASVVTDNSGKDWGKGYVLTDTPLTGFNATYFKDNGGWYSVKDTTPTARAAISFNQDGTLDKKEADISSYNSGSIGIVLNVNGGPYTSTYYALWLE